MHTTNILVDFSATIAINEMVYARKFEFQIRKVWHKISVFQMKLVLNIIQELWMQLKNWETKRIYLKLSSILPIERRNFSRLLFWTA